MNGKKIWNIFMDILTIIVVVGGIGLSLWVTFGVLLVGGIQDIITAAQMEVVDGGLMAWGIVKALFFECGGLISLAGLGLACIFQDWKFFTK